MSIVTEQPAETPRAYTVTNGQRRAIGTSQAGPATRSDGDLLTAWQLRILALIADGLTKEQVAERLHLSPNTVKSHTWNIRAQLKARNVAHAVAIAYRKGLLQ